MVFTVGHSNRTAQDFLDTLTAHQIDLVADVRTMPRSRHNPQFNLDTLAGSLAEVGIKYLHMPALGGLRHPRRHSTNTGWKNESFRGYADYMQTDEFERNLNDLLAVAQGRRLATMCAESVPWRCHRSMIADALTARDVPVMHILSTTRSDPHRMTSFARVNDGRVTYPPPELELF
jgi:uncharacterized protein (DUF488 family)